jgi:hypothetical protein
MPLPKQPTTPRQDTSWSIYRLRGTPAAFLGIVYAPDEKNALEKAIEETKIDPAHQGRIIVQPGPG